MPVKKIISGGQTGADRGGLEAGVALGLETGGWAPRGYLTDEGPNFSLSDLGLKEHPSWKYPPRTECNVRDADGTIIFGNFGSPGSLLTRRLCVEYHKPCFLVVSELRDLPLFKKWLEERGIEVLNVAGNRERKNPGIRERVKKFLVEGIGGQNAQEV